MGTLWWCCQMFLLQCALCVLPSCFCFAFQLGDLPLGTLSCCQKLQSIICIYSSTRVIGEGDRGRRWWGIVDSGDVWCRVVVREDDDGSDGRSLRFHIVAIACSTRCVLVLSHIYEMISVASTRWHCQHYWMHFRRVIITFSTSSRVWGWGHVYVAILVFSTRWYYCWSWRHVWHKVTMVFSILILNRSVKTFQNQHPCINFGIHVFFYFRIVLFPFRFALFDFLCSCWCLYRWAFDRTLILSRSVKTFQIDIIA